MSRNDLLSVEPGEIPEDAAVLMTVPFTAKLTKNG
jgi:hypothetical protein